MKRSLLLLPFLGLLLAFGLPLPAVAELLRPDMTGVVKNSNGEPVPGAVAFIFAAGPRKGSSPLCTYSYPDCGKRSVADAGGNFRIESLDPALDFYLLVMAPGYGPFSKWSILPEAGPVGVKLNPRDLAKLSPASHVQGRILGPDGRPVAGATFDLEGQERGDTTSWGGADTDAMAISDANGEFHIAGPKPFTAVHVVIEKQGLAKRWARLEPGKTLLLRMSQGVSVKGRLVFKGQPLRNVKLGIGTVERQCGVYLKGFHTTTDEEGRFVFDNIPSGMKYLVFTQMDSAGKSGAYLRHEFDLGKDGAPLDLGELQAQPTHRIAGRVVLTDGKSLPPQTRILLDIPGSWDFSLIPLDAEGRFEVTGVPAERVAISFHPDGYRFSTKNPSIGTQQRGINGRLTGDLPDFNILLEPGKPPGYEEIERLSYEEQQKRADMPLQGGTLNAGN